MGWRGGAPPTRRAEPSSPPHPKGECGLFSISSPLSVATLLPLVSSPLWRVLFFLSLVVLPVWVVLLSLVREKGWEGKKREKGDHPQGKQRRVVKTQLAPTLYGWFSSPRWSPSFPGPSFFGAPSPAALLSSSPFLAASFPSSDVQIH